MFDAAFSMQIQGAAPLPGELLVGHLETILFDRRQNLAEGIIKLRSGLDGVDGTEDDTPFHSPGELINVPGMIPTFVSQMSRFATVRSVTFEARVDVDLDQYRRRLVALLIRNGPRDVQVLNMYWE